MVSLRNVKIVEVLISRLPLLRFTLQVLPYRYTVFETNMAASYSLVRTPSLRSYEKIGSWGLKKN